MSALVSAIGAIWPAEGGPPALSSIATGFAAVSEGRDECIDRLRHLKSPRPPIDRAFPGSFTQLLAALLLWLVVNPLTRWRYRAIPGPIGWPLLGSLPAIMQTDITQYVQAGVQKYGRVFKVRCLKKQGIDELAEAFESKTLIPHGWRPRAVH